MKSEENKVLLHSLAQQHDSVNIGTHQSDDVSEKLTASIFRAVLQISGCLYVQDCIVLCCGRVPAANAPACTAAEGLLYKPWSLVVPTCTAR